MFTKLIVVVMFGIFSSIALAQDKFEPWYEKYQSKDADDRIQAVLKVGQLLETADEVDAVKAYEFMFQAFGDRSELVQSAAKIRLLKQPAEALPYLEKYFNSGELRDFALACEVIKTLGPDAKIYLPAIVKRLSTDDEKFRLAALHAMRVMDGEDLAPYLDQTIAALDSKNFNVQLSACRVIVQMGQRAKKAGPRLVQLADKGIASARSWATIALGAIGPHEEYDVVEFLSKRLDQFYLVDRERALIGLAYLGPNAEAALPAVEKLMDNPKKSVPHTAARTRWKITGDAKPSVAVLIKLLPTMEYGADAMDILAEMQGEAKSAVPYLIEQTMSGEAPTREAAVYALAAMGAHAESALTRLKKVAAKDKDRMIREAAAMAIATINEAATKEAAVKNDAENQAESERGDSEMKNGSGNG